MAAARDRRDRGPALLAARRRRLRRHRARARGRTSAPARSSRAARRSRSSSCATSTSAGRRRSTARSRRPASRSSCRRSWSKPLDPRHVPEHRLLRQPRLRRRGRRADVLLQAREPADAAAGGAARRPAAGAVGSTTRSTTRRPRSTGATRCCARCSRTSAITLAQYRCAIRSNSLGLKAGPHLHAHQAAVLLLVRDRRARQASTARTPCAQGGLEGLHDDRSAPAAAREQGDPRHPPVQGRSRRRDRLGRAGHRRDPRDDGGRPRKSGNQFNLAAQSARQAGSTFKTFVLASAIEKGIDPDSTYYTSAPFTCSIGPWCQGEAVERAHLRPQLSRLDVGHARHALAPTTRSTRS